MAVGRHPACAAGRSSIIRRTTDEFGERPAQPGVSVQVMAVPIIDADTFVA